MNINSKQVDNVQYVTSSRAAQLSGYSQDYVGQLCRKESILCKRVGGEWHVDISTLLAYKKRFNADKDVKISLNEHVVAYAHDANKSHQEIIKENGNIYMSSYDAAKYTGYSQDYIGQLARSGSVIAKKVGRKWFVDKKSLEQHKKHNDALLAAVQSEASGVSVKYNTRESDTKEYVSKQPKSEDTSSFSRTIPIVKYERDNGSLVPGSHAFMQNKQEETLPEVKVMSNIQEDEVKFIHKNLRNKHPILNQHKRNSSVNKAMSGRENNLAHVHIMRFSIVQRLLLLVIVCTSLIIIIGSLLLPEILRVYMIYFLDFMGLPINNSFIENIIYGKELLQLFDSVTFYEK